MPRNFLSKLVFFLAEQKHCRPFVLLFVVDQTSQHAPNSCLKRLFYGSQSFIFIGISGKTNFYSTTLGVYIKLGQLLKVLELV